MTQDELKEIQWAVMIPVKKWLTREEVLFYTNMASSTLHRKLKENNIYSSSAGYYDREEIDEMIAGKTSKEIRG